MVVRCPAFQQSAAAAPARRRRARGRGGPRNCPAEPSRGAGPEEVRTSGAEGPDSSARRSAAVSKEVRAPGGVGAFPRGAGAESNLGPSQLGWAAPSLQTPHQRVRWGTARVFGRRCEAPGEQRRGTLLISQTGMEKVRAMRGHVQDCSGHK